MALAFIYPSDYQLVLSRGLTLEQAIGFGYLVWAEPKDTHIEECGGIKVRCLN